MRSYSQGVVTCQRGGNALRITVSSSSKQGGSGREDSRAPSVFYSFEDTLFRMSDINMPHSCSKKLLIVTGTDIIRQTTLITDIWPAWRQLILTCWQLVVPPAF